jgi:divalent metal cation (Fe/Co/Zn/Cd) transporter
MSWPWPGWPLSQLIGSLVPQAVAAVLISLVLIRISLRLVKRNHDFLLGQPIQPADRDRVRTFLLTYPGVTEVQELLVTYIGPDQVWVLVRLNIADDLRSGQVTALVSGIEVDLKQQSPYIYRVDVVPVGNDEAPDEDMKEEVRGD